MIIICCPFVGKANIAYIPNEKIIGLSKISMEADVFSWRLQVQERLTEQILDCINYILQTIGVGPNISFSYVYDDQKGQKQN